MMGKNKQLDYSKEYPETCINLTFTTKHSMEG